MTEAGTGIQGDTSKQLPGIAVVTIELVRLKLAVTHANTQVLPPSDW